MTSVGVRELRDNLSGYLRRVQQGELVLITDRGRPIGELSAVSVGRNTERALDLVRRGVAAWSGGKPRGLAHPVKPRAGLVSVAVVEDRR
jgi:antitoxin (DNA-binding transcriptional repressor) of toxin-antitoxin stability system